MFIRAVFILCAFFTACSIRLHTSPYPHFEYAEELERTPYVLKYDKWAVTQEEFFNAFPEYRAFNEELSAVQTAVALRQVMKKIGDDHEIQITGCTREAGLMALSRLGTAYDEKKLIFKDSQGPQSITANGRMYRMQDLSLNQMDLAYMQSSYYIKGQRAAEHMLIKKMLGNSEKHAVVENLNVSVAEVKAYLAQNNIDPKMIGLRGLAKVREQLMAEKEQAAFKEYADRKIFKYPIQSRWQKPDFSFSRLPDRPFIYGRGSQKLVVFAPYDCHACMQFNQTLKQFMAKDNVEIKYFPAIADDSRKNSIAYYESALCLNDQRREIFWTMIDHFKNIYSRSTLEEKMREFIKEENLSQDKYSNCMGKNRYISQIDGYKKFSEAFDFKTFPVVVAGSFILSGNVTGEDIQEAFDASDMYIVHNITKWMKKQYHRISSPS